MVFVTYPLVSLPGSRHALMTELSVATLRATNKEASPTLMVDKETLSFLPSRMLDLFDKVSVLKVAAADIRIRSRAVKIQAANASKRPFLLLDSDTIVRDSLYEIYSTGADVAAAPNLLAPMLLDQIDTDQMSMIKMCRLQISKQIYVNSGVVFFNETEVAERVLHDWARIWERATQESEYFYDQPCLNSAICENDALLWILPDRYNAQIRAAYWSAENAAIWHYFASYKDSFDIIDLLLELVKRGRLKDAVGLALAAEKSALVNGSSRRFASRLILAGIDVSFLRDVVLVGGTVAARQLSPKRQNEN